MKKNTLISAMLLLAAMVYTQSATAATIGYSNGDCGRAYVFRTGSTTTQGMAIKLGPEKLRLLKGRTISAIETVFGSRQTTDNKARLFIATDPADESPLREQELTIASNMVARWVTQELDEPYTITGDEGTLYIGYTAEIGTNYQLLSADYSNSTKDVCVAYKDGQWTDIYSLGVGCANVRAVVDDGGDFTDLTLKTLGYEGYHKAGTPYEYSGQLLNFGTETVTSFDISISIGDSEPVTYKYDDVSVAPGSTFDFSLPEYTATETGNLPITVSVGNVNGTDDGEMSDNSQAETMFFYPYDMERNLLLEGFTGQDCSQCPAGHAAINSFLKSTDQPVIEVMHHIGYYPDIYTMAEDDAYLLFYGSSSNFAPAFTMNRLLVPASGNNVPIMNTGTSLMNTAASYISDRQPYVSLKLESDYDETSREAKVRLVVYAHNNLPTDQNVLNVMIVQDSIKGYQVSGGSNYTHVKVSRGTTTGNAWGMLLPDGFAAGDSVVYETTYTLPEAIYSSYWIATAPSAKGYSTDSVTIATDPAQTYLVAYVAAYGGDDPNGHEVYNCAEVKLGESHTQSGATGIETAPTAKDADIRIKADGRRIVVEGCDGYNIYNVAGRRVSANGDLTRGLYIVRATANGKQTTRKIVIR